ncbi:hypothetical protein PVAG01_01813 [Phlyctema vagabunda]|uniref:Uncharacterized protein n=1 Tax=Phlyctema vagabunda TaxID=108571 RepID=A0ABR4PYG7_9HELO
MKPPSSITGAKGDVNLLANDVKLAEYEFTEKDRQSSCSVLTAPGEIINASFSIESGTDEIVDLIVDGILRESKTNNRSAKVHKHTFSTVCHNPRKHPDDPKKTVKAGLRMFRMQVRAREIKHDVDIQESRDASSVGTIELRFYRKGGQPSENEENEEGVLQRGPNFNEYPIWSDLNVKIGPERPAPAFEIAFVNPLEGKNYSLQKKRVTEEHPIDYKLWASFKFSLRSAANLRGMGFINLPMSSPSLPIPGVSQRETGPSSSSAKEFSSHSTGDKITQEEPPSENSDSDSDSSEEVEVPKSISSSLSKGKQPAGKRIDPRKKSFSAPVGEEAQNAGSGSRSSPKQSPVRATGRSDFNTAMHELRASTGISNSVARKNEKSVPDTQRNKAESQETNETSGPKDHANPAPLIQNLPESSTTGTMANPLPVQDSSQESSPQFVVPELSPDDLPKAESIEQDEVPTQPANGNTFGTKLPQKKYPVGLAGAPAYSSWRGSSQLTENNSSPEDNYSPEDNSSPELPEVPKGAFENQPIQISQPEPASTTSALPTPPPSSRKPVAYREESVPASSVSMLRIGNTPQLDPLANVEELVHASQATTASLTASQEAEEKAAAAARASTIHAGEKRKADMISHDSTMSALELESRKSQIAPTMRGALQSESEPANSTGHGAGSRSQSSVREVERPSPVIDAQEARRLAAETYNRLEQQQLNDLPEVERWKRLAHKRYADALCERNRLNQEHETALLEHQDRAEIRELNIQAERVEAECVDLKEKIASLRGE